MMVHNGCSYIFFRQVSRWIILIIVLLIKNLLMSIILHWLKKLRRILKLLNLKLVRKSGLLNITIFLVKVTPKIGQEKYLWLILCWKIIFEQIELKIQMQKKNNTKLLRKRIVVE